MHFLWLTVDGQVRAGDPELGHAGLRHLQLPKPGKTCQNRTRRSGLDLFLGVDRAFAQQESAKNAAGDAVIPTSYGRVDEVGTRHYHGWSLLLC
jgi:hypothetical protein